MIGMFYTLTEEKTKWEKERIELEKKLIESNHRCLDMQYICDDQAKEIERLTDILKNNHLNQ